MEMGLPIIFWRKDKKESKPCFAEFTLKLVKHKQIAQEDSFMLCVCDLNLTSYESWIDSCAS